MIFFHHGDTEDTEVLFLFAHRETAMGKKTWTFGETTTAHWNLDFLYAPASMLFVCRHLPTNEKNSHLRALGASTGIRCDSKKDLVTEWIS